MKSQRNSFRGRRGFAITVDRSEAECGEAIIGTITILVSSLLRMDVSVYSLGSLPATHHARSRERGPRIWTRRRRLSRNKVDVSGKLDPSL